MSQTYAGKALAAEERTEEAKSFVHRVNSATRHKHTSEEKIRIVLEGFRREVTVNELCRQEGIKPHSYYAWTKEFMETVLTRMDDYLQRHTDIPRITNPALPSEAFYRHWDRDRYAYFRERGHQYAIIAREALASPSIEDSIRKWRRLFGNDFGRGRVR